MHVATQPSYGMDLLPPTQQDALRAAAVAPLRFNGARQHYEGRQTTHAVRTVRALARANLVELADGHAHLTIAGRELAGEGGR